MIIMSTSPAFASRCSFFTRRFSHDSRFHSGRKMPFGIRSSRSGSATVIQRTTQLRQISSSLQSADGASHRGRVTGTSSSRGRKSTAGISTRTFSNGASGAIFRACWIDSTISPISASTQSISIPSSRQFPSTSMMHRFSCTRNKAS